MRLLDKLLGYVHSAFDTSPKEFAAFRVRHTSPAFRWVVADRVFSGFDGNTELFSFQLEGMTVRSLIDALWTVSGVDVPYATGGEYLDISACCLIDGSGSQSASNGDVVSGYTSTLWALLDALSKELGAAKNAVVAMLDQMSIRTADEEWLDEWGDHFGIKRLDGELDEHYANRIVVEVMRPRGNNKAIEVALKDRFGQDASVEDVVRWSASLHAFNGVSSFNGVRHYDASANPIYGLFEVVVGYDLLSGSDPAQYADDVRAFIEAFRDAGTQMESLRLSSSEISDSFTGPSDGQDNQPVAVSAVIDEAFAAPSETVPAIPVSFGGMSDTAAAGDDATVLDVVSYRSTYSGARTFDGSILYASGRSVTSPAAEAMVLDFAADGSLVDSVGGKQVTFTRSSTGTYFGPDGLLKTAAINAPRFEFDPVTRRCLGLLIEESRTNLLARSSQFDDPAWANVRSTITPGAVLAPDGTLSGSKLVVDATAASNHYARELATIVANGAYTASVFFKAAEHASIDLRFYDSPTAADGCAAIFNSQTKSVVSPVALGAGALISASISDVGDGWFRASITGKSNATETSIKVQITVATSSNSTNITDATATQGVYIWGAQLEAGVFATSYIPTTSAAVTRSADLASMTGTAFSSWFNQSAGSFLFEFDSLGSNSRTNDASVFCVSNPSANWYPMIGVTFNDNTGVNRLAASIYDEAGVSQLAGVYSANGALSFGAVARGALAYQSNDVRLALAGSVVGANDDSVSLPAGLDRLLIGNYYAPGNRPVNGHVARLAYYPSRLPDASLAQMTA